MKTRTFHWSPGTIFYLAGIPACAVLSWMRVVQHRFNIFRRSIRTPTIHGTSETIFCATVIPLYYGLGWIWIIYRRLHMLPRSIKSRRYVDRRILYFTWRLFRRSLFTAECGRYLAVATSCADRPKSRLFIDHREIFVLFVFISTLQLGDITATEDCPC